MIIECAPCTRNDGDPNILSRSRVHTNARVHSEATRHKDIAPKLSLQPRRTLRAADH